MDLLDDIDDYIREFGNGREYYEKVYLINKNLKTL